MADGPSDSGAVFLGMQVLNLVKSSLGVLITRQVDGVVRDRLATASTSAAGVASLEDQDLLKHLAIARDGLEEERRTPRAAVAGLLTLSGTTRDHCSPPCNRGSTSESGQTWRVSPPITASKELRIFGLTRWLSTRFREVLIRALTATVEERRAIRGNRFIPPVFAALTVSLDHGRADRFARRVRRARAVRAQPRASAPRRARRRRNLRAGFAPLLHRAMTEQIVVLQTGRVAEVGSHDDLMRNAGLYSELYTPQGASYRRGCHPPFR